MLPSAVSDSRVHNILPNKIDTDFQFSRASAATRVNHQGLIENVGYFGPELVQNGNFSELGSEIIVNGDFATDSNWTKQAGWSINNGKAVANLALNSYIAQNFSGGALTSGKTYKIVLTVSDYTTGNLKPQFSGGGGTQDLATINANGTYTYYVVATNNATGFRLKGISSGGGFTGSIDNVSVKQVDPDEDWDLNANWSYGSNKVIANAATLDIEQQNLNLPSGKIYKTTFTIEDYVSGTVRIRFRGGSTVDGTFHSGNGTYTEILTSTGHTNIRIDGGTAFTGSVTNVSVVEVQGDKPRLDYDPLNPTCPHLLLEPQSTNLIKFSEDFSNSYWTKNSISIISDVLVSPDGTANASTITEDSTLNNHRISVNGLTGSGTHTISVFAKANSRNWLLIRNAANNAWFDVLNGVVGTVQSGTANIEYYGNGWYKCSLIMSSLSTPAFGIADNNNSYSYQGNGTGSLYVWGAMIEQLSYATSYIPTAGSTITRVAETCNNAGNVDTFNSTEGVLYAEIAALADDLTNRDIAISDGTGNNRVFIYYSTTSNQIVGRVRVSNSDVALLTYTLTDETEYAKVALKWKANDFALWVDGSERATDTSGSVFSANTLNIVAFDAGESTNDFYGKVKGLATYNRALTDTELYTITSTQYSAYSGMVAALGNYTIPC